MVQELYDLPEGWEWRQLGKLSEFQGGTQPPKKEFIYEPRDGYIRFLQIRDFSSNKNITYIAKSTKNRICNVNDILIGRYGASVGKILTGKDGAYNVAIIKTMPDKSIMDVQFFRRYLESDLFQQPLLNKTSARAAQAGFSKKDIESYPVPLPPLNEQKRIATKLDALFTRIDTAITHLQQTLELTKVLFASALDETFEKNTAWQPMKIKDVFDVINGRAYKKPELLESGKYPVVRIQNLKGGQSYYYSDLELNEDKYCNQNDLLFSWSGTPGTSFGAFVWGGGKSIFHYHIWNMKALIEINDRFAYWLLRDLTQEAIENSRGVAGMLHITKGMMESFDVEIPLIEKQEKIAANLDALSERTRTLEGSTKEKLNDLTTLKASLLDAAFKGEL